MEESRWLGPFVLNNISAWYPRFQAIPLFSPNIEIEREREREREPGTELHPPVGFLAVVGQELNWERPRVGMVPYQVLPLLQFFRAQYSQGRSLKEERKRESL